MKPVAIDLFCGKGGWTDGLLEAGFEVYGFDLYPQPDYKGIFVHCDILKLTAADLAAYKPAFVTCSSPCEEFSIHGLKCFHPNPKYPEMGVRLFNHARDLCELLSVPYVMENVRAARQFVGPSTNHCGPFYLWGSGVPACFPPDAYKVRKGFAMGAAQSKAGMTRSQITAWRRVNDPMWNASGSPARKAATAQAAMIPLPIARAVAEGAKLLLESKEFELAQERNRGSK